VATCGAHRRDVGPRTLRTACVAVRGRLSRPLPRIAERRRTAAIEHLRGSPAQTPIRLNWKKSAKNDDLNPGTTRYLCRVLKCRSPFADSGTQGQDAYVKQFIGSVRRECVAAGEE
jgi:hypothetical protein